MSVTVRKLSVAQWRAKHPRKADPTRPAVVVSRKVIVEGTQGVPPIEEAVIVCDDGKRRTFVSGPEGRWVKR